MDREDVETLKKIVEYEEELLKKYPDMQYPGWEWHDIPIDPSKLRKWILSGIVKKLGKRWYYLADREAVKKMIQEWDKKEEPQEQMGEKSGEAHIPEDLFSVIEGYEDLKEFFRMALKSPEPIHVLLVGPPGTAKSLFLMELERLPGSRFVVAGTSTKAGIRDVISEELPKYLIIDELDKIDNAKDLSCLLTWMETGRIIITQAGRKEERISKGWVFAAANTTKGLPPELLDRMQVFRISPYTQEQFERVVVGYLVKRMGVDEELAKYIAKKVGSYSSSVREAIRVACLAKTKEEVDRLMNIFIKYR
jgi:Holliday junction DNA helicase RuvB